MSDIAKKRSSSSKKLSEEVKEAKEKKEKASTSSKQAKSRATRRDSSFSGPIVGPGGGTVFPNLSRLGESDEEYDELLSSQEKPRK